MIQQVKRCDTKNEGLPLIRIKTNKIRKNKNNLNAMLMKSAVLATLYHVASSRNENEKTFQKYIKISSNKNHNYNHHRYHSNDNHNNHHNNHNQIDQ